MWYNAQTENQPEFDDVWKPGDVIGSLLDLDTAEIIFYHNGKPLKSFSQVFNQSTSGFFAAASFMSFQQCRFNFGDSPFKFPPRDRQYQTFNDHARLTADEKVILPRQMMLEILKKHTVKDDACTLCFDLEACVVLKPCGHQGICQECAKQLDSCPMCRSPLKGFDVDEK